MNELKGFYSDQFGAIRAVNIDGEPWFNATDITTALGYRNSRDAIAKHVAREDARLFLKSQIATLEDFPNRGLTFMAEVMDTCFVRKNNGSVFPTVLTSVEFNYLGFTNLKCDLDTPERTASSYGGKAAEIYQKMKRITQRHYTEFEKQMNSLSERLDNSSGVYMTTEEQSDGSNIYYLHDKPTLKESQIVWKMTAEAVAVSSDGGKTWNAGLPLFSPPSFSVPPRANEKLI